MFQAKPSIRIRASGILIRDDKILLIECHDEIGLHYNLPGGGVDYYEAVREGVIREMCEETCLDVTVGRLLLTVEALHENAKGTKDEHHSIGLVFECHAAPDVQPKMPENPDAFQTDVVWMPVEKLAAIPLLPDIGKTLIQVLRDDPDAPRFVRHTQVPGQ